MGCKYMRIALLNFYTRIEEYPNRYSLPTLRLGEYLSSFGYNVDLIPIDLNNFINVDYSSIAQSYDLVGLSDYSWVANAVKYVSRKLREYNSNCEIVIGGSQVEIIDINDWDDEYFIIGEGEVALKNLCDYINCKKKGDSFFDNNPNVFNKQNKSHRKLETNIAVKNPLFTNMIIPKEDRKFMWYETCRGCAFNCGYCGHKSRHNVAYIDLDIIEKEIKIIGEYGFEKLFVIDPNFAGTKERAKKVMKLFNKYASNTSIGLYFRPEFIDDEMISILRQANINEVRIGIQTVNPAVPQWIRSNNLKKVIEELPKLSVNNINWRAELITGLPGDNLVGLKKSMDFVETLYPTEYYSYHLTVIPNTPLYELKDNFSNKEWIITDEFSRAIESSSYTKEEMMEMLEYAKKRTTEYNNVKVKKISRR